MSDTVSFDEELFENTIAEIVDELVHVVEENTAENRDETDQIGTDTATSEMRNHFTICGVNANWVNEATQIDAVCGNDAKYDWVSRS